MTIFQAIFLGFIQGLTEFLPISSSGHLIFLPKLFGWSDQGLAFDVVVHLGSLLAVVGFFRRRLVSIIKDFFSRGQGSAVNRRFGWLLILSIIPVGIVGFFGADIIEETLRSIKFIACGLIFWGIILYVADRYNRVLQKRNISLSDTKHLSLGQVIFVALAQAVALIPGTSRSGITMTAGLFAKLDRESAAEFSFLMSVPVIGLAGAIKVIELFQTGLGDLQLSFLVLGFMSAGMSGFFAIWGLMKIIRKWSFAPFAIYRVIVGILILLFLM
ncbi:MAG: undecaprenyl-diphosphatase UppP [Candidatus Magasanikbacteria bacterium]